AELRALLPEQISLAAVNGPARCVVSGPPAAIEALALELAARDIPARRLHTSHAFHSAMVEPILDAFAMHVGRVHLRPPQRPYISNLTGDWIADAEATDPAYWVRHLRQTVRFAAGLQTLRRAPGQIWLEVGPGRSLSALAQPHPDHAPDQVVLASLPHPQEHQPDLDTLLRSLGRLWQARVPIDWAGFHRDEQRQ